ncbi:MAG TPA: hypothetical protein VH277_03120 [Gemmatimonadaceae bacterium]|nr:hypothetical protein [Gemmatimonadaceae bacterium]
MEERQSRTMKAATITLDMLERAGDALGPELRSIRERLRSAVKEVKGLAVQQDLGRYGQDQSRQLAEQAMAVRTVMIRLAGVTRLRFRDHPQVLKALAVPHKRTSASRLATAALAMTAALEPHRDFLTSEGVDLRRLDRVKTGAATLAALVHERDTYVPPSREATSRLPAALSTVSSEMAAARMGMLDDPVFITKSTIPVQPPKVGKRLGRKRKPRRKKG